MLANVVAHRPTVLSRPAVIITELASPPVVVASFAGAATWALRRGVPPWTVGQVTAVAAAGIGMRRALAEALRRPRPPASWWWASPTGYSYPSRHVAWAMLGYGALGDLLDAGGQAAAARGVRVTPSLLVAATRVLLAVHWPSDVVAAVIFAVAWRRLTQPA